MDIEKLNYFTMCLTAQFITLTSHDPIDVNSFLTGHCWHDDVDEVLTRQYEALKAMMENWDAQKMNIFENLTLQILRRGPGHA